jgi:signal transduction histidine kinase
VLADRIMIEQVLLNLIKNGIEAMQACGDDDREVALRARRVGGMVELAVADRGCGIPLALRENLFSPFFSTKPEGMGMGLNICRSIIELHGGHLWVEDNPEGGSVFCFTLPVEEGRMKDEG